MAKVIDFTKINVQVSFNGDTQVFNVAKALGNSMKYTGSVVGDIGFDKLAETIYFSNEPVEIPQEYVASLAKVISEMPLIAAVKRELLKQVNG